MEEKLWMEDNSTSECHNHMHLPSSFKLILATAYIVVGVLSLMGNCLVLLVLLLRKQTRTVTNIFISSVSAADLVITVFSLWSTPLAKYQQRWMFGRPLCFIVYAIQGASLMWAPFTLAAIAIDRFLLVSTPYRPQMSTRTALLVILGIWSGAFLVLTPAIEHVQYFDFGDCLQLCVEFWETDNELRFVYGISVFIIRSLVPLIVISFCHWRIASILNCHGKKLKSQRSSSEATSASDIRRKQRLQKLLLSMVLIFVVSSFPLDLINIIQDISSVYKKEILSRKLLDFFYFVSHWLAMAGCLLNPLVYAWYNDNFRTHIKSIFCPSPSSTTLRTVLLFSKISHPAQTTTLMEQNEEKEDVRL